MRGYWLRILSGALLIFAVGMGLVSLIRAGVRKGVAKIESAEPISIPLAFVPFKLDGQAVGTIRRLTILRSAPKSLSGFRVRVEAADLDLFRRLAANDGCVIFIDDPTKLDENTTFSCRVVDSSMAEFGEVQILAQSGGARVNMPLYISYEAWRHYRESGADSLVTATAVDNARAAQAHAESLRIEARKLADSIRSRVSGQTLDSTPK